MLNGSNNDIIIAAGISIIQDDKILLIHPTGAKWYGTFSIPKGHLEDGEDILEAALRETKEEIGLVINKRDIISGPHSIDYIDNEKIFKKVYYFIAKPTKIIDTKTLILQKEEVDWAGFFTKEDAKKRILWRLKNVLSY